MINDEEKKEISKLIRDASSDLDEFYSKIKKSEKILKYMSDGNLINNIYVNILANFSILQILEFSVKSKMIHDDTNRALSRKERFDFGVGLFKERFDYIYSQHLGIMEEKNDNK